MGTVYSQVLGDPATTPDCKAGPTFEPLYGFPEGRKERVMLATQEEMESAGLPLDKRDYCAHLALKHRACRHKEYPFVFRCAHEKHAYLNCQYDDYVLRMKEHEREKRLLERAKRKAKREAREAMDE